MREAHSALRELIAKRSRGCVDVVAIAGAYALLGERDRAFAWLDTAYTDRSVYLLALPYFPAFDAMRGDFRYRALVKKIGLPDSSLR